MAVPPPSTWAELLRAKKPKTPRSLSQTVSTLMPTVSSTNSSTSPDLGMEQQVQSERPAKSRHRVKSNPFESTWALLEQYVERYCILPVFRDCKLFDRLWECCLVICEIKVDSGGADLRFMENKWGGLMSTLNELCSELYPRDHIASHTCYITEPALSPASDIPLKALRLAIAELVKNTPLVISGSKFDDVRHRLELVEELWRLRELEKPPSSTDDLSRHYAILGAIWRLLEASFSSIEAHHFEATFAESWNAPEKSASFKLRRRREKAAFEACWRACEVLSPVVVDSVWCKSEKEEDNDMYLELYFSPIFEQSVKPTGTKPYLPNSEDPHRRGICKSVNEWKQSIAAAENELDQPDTADHSDKESAQISSVAGGEKGVSYLSIVFGEVPAQKPESSSCTAVTGAAISSAPDIVGPEVRSSSPRSWDELASSSIQEGPVGPEVEVLHDPWQVKEKVDECDAAIREEKSPQISHHGATTSTQASLTCSASNSQTHTTEAETRRSIPPKPPPPVTATPVPNPPSSSTTPPKAVSICTRCSTLELSDIEAIHHIRLRILLLHAAITRGYSSTSGRKFADFVRDMPATTFGDTKAQKKLFNTYRRAVLYSTDNIKGKGDTVAHEASVMQVKAAVEWKTQGGKHMFLRDLYKQVVGVEIEKMESLSQKAKATIMTG